MNRIIRVIEEKYPPQSNPRDELETIQDAIGKASTVIAEQINAAAIIPLTSSGLTAKNIAKYRPKTPIIVLTDNDHIQRRMASFVWGTAAYLVPNELNPDNIYEQLSDFAKSNNIVNPGESVVFVSGQSAGTAMSQNMIKVYVVN
jgi:pyruvate kinase